VTKHIRRDFYVVSCDSCGDIAPDTYDNEDAARVALCMEDWEFDHGFVSCPVCRAEAEAKEEAG